MTRLQRLQRLQVAQRVCFVAISTRASAFVGRWFEQTTMEREQVRTLGAPCKR